MHYLVYYQRMTKFETFFFSPSIFDSRVLAWIRLDWIRGFVKGSGILRGFSGFFPGPLLNEKTLIPTPVILKYNR